MATDHEGGWLLFAATDAVALAICVVEIGGSLFLEAYRKLNQLTTEPALVHFSHCLDFEGVAWQKSIEVKGGVNKMPGTYDYGDAEYWDARYLEEAGASFDWYQRYSALRPILRKFISSYSRILMVGCGNALMSEDMARDGYVDIMNIDISFTVIETMRKKCMHIPQLKYMHMDVRDMSFFKDDMFDSVVDKGTLDSLMCGTNAPLSASQMIKEVHRVLKPGGVYMLITYGDPSVRIPHLNQLGCCWKITLYILQQAFRENYAADVHRTLLIVLEDQVDCFRKKTVNEGPRRRRYIIKTTNSAEKAVARPGFEGASCSSSPRSVLESIILTKNGLLPSDYVLEDPESHYVYVCKKMEA